MDFSFFASPHLQFGPGKIRLLPGIVKSFGKTLLLITGSESFQKSYQYQMLIKNLKKASISVFRAIVKTEPSPAVVDKIVAQYKNKNIDIIAAVGGGSVLDAGKAVSAMMTKQSSVLDYLEGVGVKSHDGKKIPFIAVPTTSGTGSEATKNAVISNVGPDGFKKSLRHDNFIPDIAVIDPELTLDCPGPITAACGMDALTQLIESYVSVNSSAMTDSLASGALKIIGNALLKVNENPQNIEVREKLSYASYISGLTLANSGLGVVHGFASVIGGFFNIPHGIICGTLLAGATRQNIKRLTITDPEGIALQKYSRIASFLDPCRTSKDPVQDCHDLAKTLDDWADQLNIPKPGAFGVTSGDIDRIVELTGIKNNPVQLTKSELTQILKERL